MDSILRILCSILSHKLHLELGGFHEVQLLQPEHGEQQDRGSVCRDQARIHSVTPPGLSISSTPWAASSSRIRSASA